MAAVVVVNGVEELRRSIRNTHDDESWQHLLDHVEADRPRRARLGRSEITSPWDMVRLDLDPSTDAYVAAELYRHRLRLRRDVGVGRPPVAVPP